MATIVDSYSESNADVYVDITDEHPSDSGSESAWSQSFTGDGQKIYSAKFYCRKQGSPTGTTHAVLCAHSGTFGSSSVAGSELARSDAINSADIPGTIGLVEWLFTGADQVTMTSGTKYVIYCEGPQEANSVDASNYIRFGVDGSTPAHNGNLARYLNNAWQALSSYDLCFYVYGEAAAGGLSIPVAMHHYGTINKIIRG